MKQPQSRPKASTPKDLSIYQREVDRNYEVFQQLPDDYCRRYHGMHALMKNQKIVQLFSNGDDAYRAAKLIYKDKPFSIQEVGAEPIDLGFYSHAIF